MPRSTTKPNRAIARPVLPPRSRKLAVPLAAPRKQPVMRRGGGRRP